MEAIGAKRTAAILRLAMNMLCERGPERPGTDEAPALTSQPRAAALALP